LPLIIVVYIYPASSRWRV